MDFNSIRNQEIKGQFVQKHIYACVTSVIEYILTKGDDPDAPFSSEDLADKAFFEDRQGNTYSPGAREEQLEVWQAELDALALLIDVEDNDSHHQVMYETLEERMDELSDAQEQYAEIYEWWICSSWLAKKLKEYDQIILEDGNNSYWGRCTTGQAILLDLVISRICGDLEILDGQVNMWT